MSKKFYIFAILLLASSPVLLAHAQVTSSTTILVPSDANAIILQIVTNLFADNSIGGIVYLIVGVLLALTAITILIDVLVSHRK